MNDYQARYAALSDKDKRFFDRLIGVEKGRYAPSADEAFNFAKLYDNNFLEAFTAIFTYGFLKGQRQEKARAKKRAKEAKAREERFIVPCDARGQACRECIQFFINKIGSTEYLEWILDTATHYHHEETKQDARLNREGSVSHEACT